MRSPVRGGRHLRQEREANAFAIEVLTPRHLLLRHLKRAADLEHALAISRRFDVSRAAAGRRYVQLHEDCLAAIFSRHGRVLYVERPDEFPATTVWSNDALPELSDPPRDGSDLTSLDEADPTAWLKSPAGTQLFAQTLFQRDGYAITLLLAETMEKKGRPRSSAVPGDPDLGEHLPCFSPGIPCSGSSNSLLLASREFARNQLTLRQF